MFQINELFWCRGCPHHGVTCFMTFHPSVLFYAAVLNPEATSGVLCCVYFCVSWHSGTLGSCPFPKKLTPANPASGALPRGRASPQWELCPSKKHGSQSFFKKVPFFISLQVIPKLHPMYFYAFVKLQLTKWRFDRGMHAGFNSLMVRTHISQ